MTDRRRVEPKSRYLYVYPTAPNSNDTLVESVAYCVVAALLVSTFNRVRGGE